MCSLPALAHSFSCHLIKPQVHLLNSPFRVVIRYHFPFPTRTKRFWMMDIWKRGPAGKENHERPIIIVGTFKSVCKPISQWLSTFYTRCFYCEAPLFTIVAFEPLFVTDVADSRGAHEWCLCQHLDVSGLPVVLVSIHPVCSALPMLPPVPHSHPVSEGPLSPYDTRTPSLPAETASCSAPTHRGFICYPQAFNPGHLTLYLETLIRSR